MEFDFPLSLRRTEDVRKDIFELKKLYDEIIESIIVQIDVSLTEGVVKNEFREFLVKNYCLIDKVVKRYET